MVNRQSNSHKLLPNVVKPNRVPHSLSLSLPLWLPRSEKIATGNYKTITRKCHRKMCGEYFWATAATSRWPHRRPHCRPHRPPSSLSSSSLRPHHCRHHALWGKWSVERIEQIVCRFILLHNFWRNACRVKLCELRKSLCFRRVPFQQSRSFLRGANSPGVLYRGACDLKV